MSKYDRIYNQVDLTNARAVGAKEGAAKENERITRALVELASSGDWLEAKWDDVWNVLGTPATKRNNQIPRF